ncbi:MAG: hypothetical protein J6R59_09745 [Paludibacteraceae bacterium]|nr:hypothetical protein [Paludibacteraceae bacterium]
MSLSFEDSLKNNIENPSVKNIVEIPMVVSDMGIDDNSIMTLDVPPMMMAAYSGEDGNWQQHTDYVRYHSFSDDYISNIDDEKNITLHKKQFNITQEENSQYIPFEMPRYYDGFDLVNTVLSIHYNTKNGRHGASKPVNVTFNDEKIRFGWLVDAGATLDAGTLEFEIHAYGTVTGSDGISKGYTWKTKSNKNLNVLESLCDCEDVINNIDDTWMQELVADIAEKVADEIKNVAVGEQVKKAEDAAASAEQSANDAKQYADDASSAAIEAVNETLENYATISYVDEAVAGVDVTEQLVSYVKTSDLESNYYNKTDTTQLMNNTIDSKGYATTSYVDNAISEADISSKLNDYYKKSETYSQSEIDEKVSNVTVDLTGYATESFVTDKIGVLSSDVATNKENISSISKTLGELQEDIGSIDSSPRLTYDVAYNDTEDEEVGENVFVLYEITGEGTENEVREAKRKFTIVGGSGGGGSSSLKISYVTTSPVVATVNDKVLITYNFSGTDSSGDIVSEGNYTWKIGSKVIASGIATSGENTFDATNFATTTSQKFVLSITDDAGSLVTKSWTVQKVDVRLESTFSDAYAYNIGAVPFNYTPYGAIEKDIHFILDGEELGVVKTSTSGIPMSYIIPAQEHGSHLLEVYMTTTINNTLIESNHIYKDIIWSDSANNTPIIGCATQTIDAMQYNTVNIKYTVVDPNTETPKVTWSIDGKVVSEETLTEKDEYGYYTYSYKANNAGTFVFTISCGEAEPKIITVNVEELNINVSPVTAGLEFDFNPVGYSNSSADRLWSYNDVTMTVSDNFDWVNGGYQIDEKGDQYFCIKAGTSAVINYSLFADDPKKTGKEFKVIFRTKNIRKRNTSFLTCMDGNIGLDMKIENATVYNSGGLLKSDYCEDTIIEYEFNINKDTDMPIVMSYEDGAPSKPCEYTETSSFKQSSPKPITIGSADCDTFIYRIKAYSISLTDTDIKNNFIADARSAEEIIARYNRNQIYNEDGKLISTSASGDFSVDALMKAAPDLRYIFLEVPQFTNDKDNKIDDCTVYFRYPAGTRPQDNWDCTGVRHRGQGTSSNLYGYSGRNIDLCMDRDESLFTWINEEGETVESSTITLTDTSVPTDYLNIKVNIASSENANNAQLARRFNEYQPFLRYARKKDSKVKDTMEFYNCVVFIRETSTDLATTPHREFNDNDWHFYAIGNVGDSKKSDDTRVNNANDPKEHVIEITDADKPLSAFPTGKDGHAICPISEWKAGNSAYDILYSTEYVYDEEGAFESFGGTTYEFRYEMEDITEEQREVNINTWRDLYKFIATSTDEEFYANLKDYFVVDSALYYYLFTERYTMVDNRGKNSFWHYGKVYISEAEAAELGEVEASYYIIDNDAASINGGYRYDLTFGYDMDTSLGIDNTGDYVFSYGKEDTDYYVDGDPTSDYVFRVADSVFFCRLRDLFPSEMQAMFKNREEKNAWNSTSLINQWDNAQAQFPEELWRLDYERKYYRTYLGLSIDNSINEGEGKGVDKSFLIGKFFGRKKYARRAFEINQEIYFATKYFGNKALSDVFWIRGNVPIGGSIKPNYSLTLVPYSDMYVCVQYTSTGTPIHKKVKAGETVRFESDAERMDFIYVYAASFIQEVGDLSRCFVGDNNFSSATRLQRLTIGSTDNGYENTFMKEVLVANNPLLEYLDLRNISGINTVINLSSCSNLKELYAEGTNATGVIFANGGLLQTAHLPSLTSLSMKNLNYIEDFVVDGYDNLQTLIVENVPNINTYDIVTNAPSLKLLRLINLNWDFIPRIENGAIFDRLLTIGGIDSSGYESDLSVLTGIASVAVIGQYDLYKYHEAWSDLTIEATTIKPQFKVTFVNEDGTVLDTQYIEQFESAVDPIEREENPISTPTKDSTIQYNYTFAGWDSDLTNIVADRIITATYTESLREYTVKYVVMGDTVKTGNGLYGDNIIYDGKIPVYTAEEPYAFYLFNRWDKSGFLDNNIDENGVKTINAIFDKFTYTANAFNGKELEDFSPVEIYAMNKLNELGTVNIQNIITDKDPYTITIGNDVEYDDIESELLISEKTYFDGSKHIDTGIQLFDEDKDFVLAIDYEFLSGNKTNAVLAQCFQANGTNGFKLWYSASNDFNGVKFTWGTTSNNVVGIDKREIIVIRHKKGDNNLTIYKSNLDGNTVLSTELTRTKTTVGTGTLVFGSARADDGIYENHATGNIHWAKVWYKDLGDDVCQSLAMWTHESITLEACGFRKYYLSDNTSKRCSFSLLASHLLGRTKKWNSTNSNLNGWANSELNKSLNTRLYNAMPTQIRELLKKVIVYSSIGQMSSELNSSNCYITIPALIEVDPTQTSEPYNSEGTSISYLSTNNSRKRAFDGGGYNAYWLRSPNVGYPNYIWRVEADGQTQGITNASTSLGVLIEISF